MTVALPDLFRQNTLVACGWHAARKVFRLDAQLENQGYCSVIAKPTHCDFSCFPENLLDPNEDSPTQYGNSTALDGFWEQDSRSWRIVYTKPRQEKSLARDLCANNIPFYLPLVPHENYIRGRRFASFVPLFSGYLFLYGTIEERQRSFDTRRIAHDISVGNQSELWRELRQVNRLIHANVPLTVERRLSVGQKARVKSGPFKGFQGELVRAGDVNKLLIAISYLGQGITLEIEPYKLEPVY